MSGKTADRTLHLEKFIVKKKQLNFFGDMEGPWHAAGPKRLFFCRQVFFGKHNFKTKSANFFIMANLGPHFFMG